ncbi:hypothetical protein ACH5RR_007224 [Cinchona calisaya]|uniref:Uncharacterized protein n=1 Tax=Cinchona calisaya TaxID=153742 RepID=A0ABD3ARI5_9GENT
MGEKISKRPIENYFKGFGLPRRILGKPFQGPWIEVSSATISLSAAAHKVHSTVATEGITLVVVQDAEDVGQDMVVRKNVRRHWGQNVVPLNYDEFDVSLDPPPTHGNTIATNDIIVAASYHGAVVMVVLLSLL